MIPLRRGLGKPGWAGLRAALLLAGGLMLGSGPGLGAEARPAPSLDPIKRVLLVSIDGLRPAFYLDGGWPAPNLQALVQRGTVAEAVTGVFPTLTYPSHTSLVTGVVPAQHGIVANLLPAAPGAGARWYTDYTQIRSDTLWAAARRAGLPTAAVSWPVSVGAPIDTNLPEIWDEATPDDRRGAIARHATPPGLLAEVEREATGVLAPWGLDYRQLAMDENNARILAYLIRTRRPALAAIHLVAADTAQHREGQDGPGVRRAVAAVDHALGTLLDELTRSGLDRETVVIVTGDHGFTPVRWRLSPNRWLADAGLLAGGHFLAAGGVAFLHAEPGAPGDPQAFPGQVLDLLAALPPDQRGHFRVLNQEEIRARGGDPDALLALAGQPDVLFDGSRESAPIQKAKGGAHGHLAEFSALATGFIAVGPGIAAGARIGQIALLDVAPTIADLLHLPLHLPAPGNPGAGVLAGKVLPLRAGAATSTVIPTP